MLKNNVSHGKSSKNNKNSYRKKHISQKFLKNKVSEKEERAVARRIKTQRNDVKSNISEPRKNVLRNVSLKNTNLNRMPINKKKMATYMTVAVTGIFGVVVLNTVVHPEENVEAVEYAPLPERELPGVSKSGQKYADDARVVMEKLQTYKYRNDGKKVVYLTFDDGPSAMTSKLLDVLEKNDIRATFFVTGQSIEHAGQKGKELLQRSYNYGNAIANHSYSHDYNLLYPNKTLDFNAFLEDFKKTDNLLKDALGKDFKTEVIRCPGGHMSWNGMDKLQDYLDEHEIASIDWNAVSGDAVGKNKTPEELYNEAVETSKGKEMVVLLMHDASSKESTVEALQDIIDYYKDNGYEFRTLV